jgi:D-glycero-alpha-D-manno-heptose-7-phosphate kinase
VAAPTTAYPQVELIEPAPRSGYYPGLVLTRTPLRISFAGGGTDLPDFSERGYGAVFTTAINRYVYVCVKQHSELFREPIRINYSKTELVDSVDEIDNDISRECLRFLNVEPPIYISTVADLPARSGLGGSSSFTVGLLHALHTYKGERVSTAQLAEEATHIELDVLGQPIGKQDQYATAFGGLNLFRFLPGARVTVEPQKITKTALDYLFAHMMVFWTGLLRDSSSVLTEQKKNTADKLDTLEAMRGHAHDIQRLTCNGNLNPRAMGSILDSSWRLKRQLATAISNSQIDEWYERAMRAGADGGKICGAGGGGFLLFIAAPERQSAIRESLSELLEVKVGPDVYGSRVLLPAMH